MVDIYDYRDPASMVCHHNHDAYGYQTVIGKSDSPTRIDEVSNTLFYLGWAVYGAAEDRAVWRIKEISQTGSVWNQKYANGNEEFLNKWTERGIISYS